MPLLAPAAPGPIPNIAPQAPLQLFKTSDERTVKIGESGLSTNNIPIVSLDVEKITDALAARLATSLIGHILYLKGQVPLPVMQLSRITSSKSTAKALKHRTDLLATFDTLTSHLNTTFTALSSALARASKDKNSQPDAQQGTTPPKSRRSRVYLAVFVGSNTASAKSKVIYAVDGLEVKAVGARDDVTDRTSEPEPHVERDNEDAREDIEEDEDDDDDDDDIDDEEPSSGDGESEEEDEEEEDSETGNCDSDDLASSPPESRSPSPEPPSYPSHAEQQRALHAAERLLSRTLAAADAEGNGMSADMAPTQTHILLRAPRRFVHPSWVPRQNMTAPCESALDEFLEDSGIQLPDTHSGKRKKVPKTGKTVQGVWVTCKGGLDAEVGKDGVGVWAGDDEWDDMIWWSWDGKIVGFSEW
ncbi:hypothetical protein LshimejAT787_0100950 [Lyophyllum shimeji]|uniref:Uncharacterized protein n=1 Tax=Lyophyllum shimeji TaxID=47721 RepID=A0A9P3PCA0_LYOSH|nr:hypothetical protein LshimejAT787_0100950 [Lyophyllum shimeji]